MVVESLSKPLPEVPQCYNFSTVFFRMRISRTLEKLEDLPKYWQKSTSNKKSIFPSLLTSFTCNTCSAAVHAFVFLHSCNCRRVPLRSVVAKVPWKCQARGRWEPTHHIGPFMVIIRLILHQLRDLRGSLSMFI